ncbi:DUF917 family protein, partial [Kibdelosporangium lantanae]
MRIGVAVPGDHARFGADVNAVDLLVGQVKALAEAGVGAGGFVDRASVVVSAGRDLPGACDRCGGHSVISRDTLPLLASGSRLLATGATASSFQIAYDWAMDVLSDGSVPLVAAADLPADTLCVAISLVGSTTAMEEQLPCGDEPARVVRAL